MACLVDQVWLCVILVLVVIIGGAGVGGSEIYSLNEDAETFKTLKVAFSGQLLVRSSRAVYLLNETGHREGSRQVRAISFLQSDDLSSDSALLCTYTSCELVRLSDLNTEIWSKNVSIGNRDFFREPVGDILSIITKKSGTEISLNTARVSSGIDSFILVIIRYDFEFTSENYRVQPSRYVHYQFYHDLYSSTFPGCKGEFHEVFSIGGHSFYVVTTDDYFSYGFKRGNCGKTYFYHTKNQDVGLIRPGRNNQFTCIEESSLKCGELTAADRAHFSRASSGDGHTLFLSYSGVICKYDYRNWTSTFTSLAMTGCGGSEATLSPLLNVSSLGGRGVGAVAALGSVVTNQHMFLLIAFENGSIHQYLVSGGLTPILLDTNQLPSSEDVVEIVSSRDAQSYYVVTEKKIYQFSIHKCSRHNSCEACVTTPNPLCGWCSAEGRCGTAMDCPMSGQQNLYVAHGSQCPVITMVTASKIAIQNISNLSQLDPTSMLVTTSRTGAISPTPPPSSPLLLTLSPVPVPTRCDGKVREFVNMRKCSAGLNIRTRGTACEYQLLYSRFCQFQKCMDSLVDLLQVCFSEAGLDKQNISAILDSTVQLHSKLFCGWDRERKDFCGVMFPEFSTVEPLTLNQFTCAIQGSTCSSNCRMIMSRAINHYGCCLNQILKLILKVNAKRLYKRCGVTPPDRCRTKLKDPRKE